MTEAARGEWEYAGCYQLWLRRHNKSISSKKKIVPVVKQHYPASSNMLSPDESGRKTSVLLHSVSPLWVEVALYQKLKMSFTLLLIGQIQHWAYAPYLILIAALNQYVLFYFILHEFHAWFIFSLHFTKVAYNCLENVDICEGKKKKKEKVTKKTPKPLRFMG